MQIVIEIPDEVVKNETYTHYLGCMSTKLDEVIYNGTPLPKGHGGLVDTDALWDAYHGNGYDFYEALNDVPIIIGADRAESEDKESDRKCHTCKHYTSGEHDGSCGSYICEHYSNWESEDKE